MSQIYVNHKKKASFENASLDFTIMVWVLNALRNSGKQKHAEHNNDQVHSSSIEERHM